ncbi:MAG: DUF4956 domain-containing protein [Planctomycetes bacterium]|nr:DUF4956 domain-containing protein [Planctomycetota bacterium]
MQSDFGLSWQMVVVTLLVSFLLCQVISAVYIWTFRGLSYTRGFVVSVALTGVVATLLMLAIGDNLARGLGMLGTLAMVRFRSTLRDVRDMTFIFATLSVGIATGVQAYMIGIIGTVVFCLAMLHLTFSPFGLRRQFDGLLRLNTPIDPDADEHLKTVLRQHCANFVLVNLREVSQGERLEQAYQIKLRDPVYREHLVAALRSINAVQDVSLLLQDRSLEV